MNCQKLENLVNFLAQMSFPVEKVFFKILTFKEGLVQSRNTKYFCEDLRRKLTARNLESHEDKSWGKIGLRVENEFGTCYLIGINKVSNQVMVS